MDDPRERRCLIALHLTPGLGAVGIARLMQGLGSAAAAWSAPQDALARVLGIGAGTAAAIARARSSVNVEGELRRADRCGARVLTWLDAAYPAALRTLRDAPPVVYVHGEWREGPEPVVAVVGTRRASAYGLGIADVLGELLGGTGVVVVSGLARGIDTAAHAAVLRVGGVTVGVLGCGVDVVYPAEHRLLIDRVRQRGAVIAEVPMGTPPRRQQFPRRNRLISGLARAVVVVEGDVDSGALITARCALAQGRQVFAVPGSVHGLTSRGPHRLLAEGARILATPSDLLAALGLVQTTGAAQRGGWPQEMARRNSTPAEDRLGRGTADQDTASMARAGPQRPGAGMCAACPPDGGTLEARVLAAMEDGALHIDALSARTGLGAGEVAAALANLEVQGLVRQFPGKHFARCGSGGSRMLLSS